MLLIEVNLTIDQKRKLLRLSKTTGKSFGEITSAALDQFLERIEENASPSIEARARPALGRHLGSDD
jgi:hypothetical protein